MHHQSFRLLCVAVLLSALLFVPRALLAKIEMVPQIGHSNYVNTLDMDAAGKVVATGGDDAKINFWDVASGALLRGVNDGGGNVWSLSFSPDGRVLLSAHADGKVRVWETKTGALLRVLVTHQGGAQFVQVLRDGRVVTVGRDGARLFESVEGGKMTRLSDDKAQKGSISQDEKYLGTVADESGLALIDLEKKKVVKRIKDLTGAATVALSPDAKQAIVTDPFKGDIKLVDLMTSAQRALEHVNGMPMYVEFLPDGQSYLFAGFGVALQKASLTGGSSQVLGDSMRARVKSGQKRLLTGGFGGFSVQVLELDTLREVQTFRGFVSPVSSAAFSPNGDRLFTLGDRHGLVVWDLNGLRRVAHVEAEGGLLALSRDAERAVVARTGIAVVDVSKGASRPLVPAKPPRPDGMPNLRVYSAAAISQDGRLVASGGGEPGIALRDADTGKMLWKIEVSREPLSLRFDEQASKLFVLTADECFSLGVKDGQRTSEISLGDTPARVGDFDQSANRVVFGVFGQKKIVHLDVRSGAVVRTFNVAAEPGAIALSPSGTRALWVDQGDDAVSELELASGAVTRIAPAAGLMRGLAYSKGDTFRAVAGNEGVIQLDHLGRKQTVRLVSSDYDWAVYTTDGLFDGSTTGSWLVAAVDEGRAFRINQVAHKNNRPDQILARFGVGSKELVDYLAGRHERRLRRLGVQEKDLSSELSLVPQIEILSDRVVGDSLELEVLASSRSADLKYFNVYANDVPIHPAPGLTTDGRHVQTTLTVPLLAGRNKVEVEVSDRAGRTSFRPFRIHEHRSDRQGRLFFLGFGVSSYKDPRLNLAYAHKDALDLAEYFRGVKGYREVIVHTFVNQEVTRDVFARASELLRSAEPEDTVVAFVAGHGTHGAGGAGEYYYVTYETEVNRLQETAAPFSALESLFSDLRALKRLLLLDTCESGEKDPGDVQVLVSEGRSRGLSSRGLALVEDSARGVAKARPFLLERDRFIASDLVRRTGTIVLSSCQGSELSYERNSLENGVFTQELLVALTSPVADASKDGAVDSRELRRYLATAVADATSGLQNPVVDRDNLEQKIALPVVPELAALVSRPLSALKGATPPSPPPEIVSGASPARQAIKVPPKGGCGCHVPGAAGDSGWALLFPLALGRLRRKARGASRAVLRG